MRRPAAARPVNGYRPRRAAYRGRTTKSVVLRESRSTAGVITKLWPGGRGTGDFLAERLFTTRRFRLSVPVRPEFRELFA
jgi:hypothetical protein